VGGGFLWTASNGHSVSRPKRSTDTGLGYIYKLDLKTGEAVDRFRTPDGGGIHGIEWDEGKIWITAFNPLAIYLADPSDNYKIVHSFEVELQRLHGLARVSDGLWCAHTTDNVVVKYDIESGAEKERITMDPGDAYIHGLSIKDGELWYGDANFAGKHNTATVGSSEIGKIVV
jgi:outer membrane protein assembly factor BamB